MGHMCIYGVSCYSSSVCVATVFLGRAAAFLSARADMVWLCWVAGAHDFSQWQEYRTRPIMNRHDKVIC